MEYVIYNASSDEIIVLEGLFEYGVFTGMKLMHEIHLDGSEHLVDLGAL